MARKFNIWISVLLESYEPIITKALLDSGYIIINSELKQFVISSQKCLFYSVASNHSLDQVEFDVCYNVLADHGIKYHFYLVSPDIEGYEAAWRGSNINYDDIGHSNLLAINSNYVVSASFQDAVSSKLSSKDKVSSLAFVKSSDKEYDAQVYSIEPPY